MSILVSSSTKVIVQGITGRDGSFHTKKMLDYGTNIVGGVTPGKGGQTIYNVPVFKSVKEAIDRTSADVSIIFVPAQFAKYALLEAANSALKLVVCITEGIPTLDVLEAFEIFKKRGIRLIGPNCPGIISPGQSKVGILPAAIHKPGTVGVISRSGTLTYEIVHALTSAGIGQSTCVGIGGDPVIGSTYTDLLTLFEADPGTLKIIMVGEIGGCDEIEAARFIKNYMTKQVVAFMAGRTAPKGKRMGHAGAIIGTEVETVQSKTAKLEEAGVQVAMTFDEIVDLIKI